MKYGSRTPAQGRKKGIQEPRYNTATKKREEGRKLKKGALMKNGTWREEKSKKKVIYESRAANYTLFLHFPFFLSR